MHAQFKQALKDITDICKFEHWLRFYFLREVDQQFQLFIPEDVLEHLDRNYEHLSGLARVMNHQFLTPEISQKMMIEYIGKTLDGPVYDHALVNSILNSKTFEAEITAFHIWSDVHADQLEQEVKDFQEWMQLFEAWKRTEKGQNMLQTLRTPNNTAPETTQ